jgi:FADH2 O2-dependent halogenase
MINVPLYDQIHPHSQDQVPFPWGQTTLHHLFDRGWLWVIPFNNVVGSRNPLCSVGLTLDPRLHPCPKDQSPAEEFAAFIQRYPSIEAQFKDARAVRPWVASGQRLQYSASGTVGDRFCLLPHSHGFVDALYSKGLAITMTVLAPLAQKILDAKQAQNYSAEFFRYIHDLTTALYDCNDALVEGSFLSFKDFDLFNCWWRIWLGVADWKFAELMKAYEENPDPQYLPWTGGVVGWSCREPDNRLTGEFFTAVFGAIKAHDRGDLSKTETINFTMEKIRQWNRPQDLGNWDQHVVAPEGDFPSHHPDYPLSVAN